MFEQYLRNPSCVSPFGEFMAKFGLLLLQITRASENSELRHTLPLAQKIQELLLKLDILRPFLSSGDSTSVDTELKLLSGNLFRDTIKTMGRSDVAPVARSIQCVDLCLRQQRYENCILPKRTPSITKDDGDQSSVGTIWGVRRNKTFSHNSNTDLYCASCEKYDIPHCACAATAPFRSTVAVLSYIHSDVGRNQSLSQIQEVLFKLLGPHVLSGLIEKFLSFEKKILQAYKAY